MKDYGTKIESDIDVFETNRGNPYIRFPFGRVPLHLNLHETFE